MELIRVPQAPEAGDVLTVPPRESWPALLERNRTASRSWDFSVAGVPVHELRESARDSALREARTFSARLGVSLSGEKVPGQPIVVTGHQPELYHPGVWVKDFLAESLATETEATAIDLVVDSDWFDVLAAEAPCMKPEVHRCTQVLARGGADVCYACAPVPPARELAEFCASVDANLETLSAPGPREHFRDFTACLERSATDARNVAELVTFARRRFEASAGTGYLELPVTTLARSGAFGAFVLDIALNAERFSVAYNDELDAFRLATGTRSSAQPFPNLRRHNEAFELPFWVLGSGRRATLWARRPRDGSVVLLAEDTVIGKFKQCGHEELARFAQDVGLAPKALALTLYARVFVADLFVHGTGGARYDRVTDGVMRRYYSIEPPRYVVASLTLRLPLETETVTEEQVAEAAERLNRFEHNPDALIGTFVVPGPLDEARAHELAREKEALVREISVPGADRKSVGLRIREVNAALREALAPLGELLQADLERLTVGVEATRVLEDRTYPFCYWEPEDVASRVRP